MESAFFWVIWGIISFWTLRIFYYSYGKEKLNRLRKTILGIDLGILILFFLPWNPPWVLWVLVAGSALLFLTNNKHLLKVGAIVNIIVSILFILVMIRLRPGTFVLTQNDMPPIIVSLLLLAGNVVVLLLWQQLQLKYNKK